MQCLNSYMSKDFKNKVLEIVKKIPKGSVLTYKEVAKKAGNENASRVVGNIMAKNFLINVPCHRVVRSDGYVGNYNRGGRENKIKLLKKEGVKIDFKI